mmetsp:Transcript_21524/g.56888  ORF Transcript_21524/g.56888 Transcript_21524/m.56888 type:complete len:291 (-) Transcript_21524:88-960(-)
MQPVRAHLGDSREAEGAGAEAPRRVQGSLQQGDDRQRPPQEHGGVRRLAHVPAGLRGGRAVPAHPRRAPGGRDREVRHQGGGHHDPHDRLPQLLRQALHGRDRLHRKGPGHLQHVPGSRLPRPPPQHPLRRVRHGGPDHRHPDPHVRAVRQGAGEEREVRRLPAPEEDLQAHEERPGLVDHPGGLRIRPPVRARDLRARSAGYPDPPCLLGRVTLRAFRSGRVVGHPASTTMTCQTMAPIHAPLFRNLLRSCARRQTDLPGPTPSCCGYARPAWGPRRVPWAACWVGRVF